MQQETFDEAQAYWQNPNLLVLMRVYPGVGIQMAMLESVSPEDAARVFVALDVPEIEYVHA